LQAEIADNADNVTARRDLALIWLARRRPERAIELLEAALQGDRDSPELLFLLGKALFMAGRAAESLPLLVAAARQNERLRYGECYLVAGKALRELGRFDEAEDALERYLAINSSSVEGRVLLACTRRARQDHDGAARATREALDTFAQVPRFRRRAEWRWYVRARLMSWSLA
jgi:tetratricopeptide (TPR) repeat protein